MSTINTPPSGISNSTANQTAEANISTELNEMNSAFEIAIWANAEITVNKTNDGAEETVAQQRPNIG